MSQVIEGEEKEKGNEIEQYFFVDSRNKIQILFPNYEDKAERVKTMEVISEKAHIKNKYQNY